MTSSPRWLITFTAMRPESGSSKGREVSLCSVAQASSLISAFSVIQIHNCVSHHPASAINPECTTFSVSKIPSITCSLPANNPSGPPTCKLLKGGS